MTGPNKIFFWTGLLIYGLLLSLLLTLYRLPADRMLGKAVTLLTGTQTLLSAEIVSFSLPLSYALERITFEAHWPQGISEDRIDFLTFSPEWSRIFSGCIPLRSKAAIGGGRIDSRWGVPFLGRGYLDARGAGIRLEEISLVEALLDRRVSGLCEGEMRLLGDVRLLSGLDGQGFLRAADGSVESKLPIAELRMIPFQSISASFIVQKGVLALNDGTITGPAISGTFSGQVQLNDRASKSLLKLTANLTPGPVMKENDLVRRFLASLAAPGQPITIRLEGSLGNPSIRWGKD